MKRLYAVHPPTDLMIVARHRDVLPMVSQLCLPPLLQLFGLLFGYLFHLLAVKLLSVQVALEAGVIASVATETGSRAADRRLLVLLELHCTDAHW